MVPLVGFSPTASDFRVGAQPFPVSVRPCKVPRESSLPLFTGVWSFVLQWMMEPAGIEPATSTLPALRSTK